MPRYPETVALMEQALRHVLSEQEKLLQRPDCGELATVLLSLSKLASHTSLMLADGFNRSQSTVALTKEAREIERMVDALSLALWTPIQVSVSAIYERVEASMRPEPGRYGFAGEIRAHYHNIRLRLLEQMIGARMLALSSDLGDETERIWQQFLERHLGPMFRVLRGGYICDHAGNKSCQVDMIVVPADAHVFVPGDSEGGKAHVLIDQVISASMITANLTVKKLKTDWEKLQTLPAFPEQDKDYPALNGHPWPLCYVLAAQSDPMEDLEKAWVEVCQAGVPRVVPQFVIALDTGFLFSGLRKWPAPRYPGNYVEATHVKTEAGVFSGLGLAWLLTQHQGRLAVTKQQALGPIHRFKHLLDDAMMPKEGVPSTFSMRFFTMFQQGLIAGALEWGSVSCWAHNGLQLRSLSWIKKEAKTWWERAFLQPGIDHETLDYKSATNFLRWFHFFPLKPTGRIVALEEWLNHQSKTEHRSRIAVFDTITGIEVTGPLVDGLNSVSELERIQAEVAAGLPPEEAHQGDVANPSP
ncbi:MAG: DUF6602 domain-containing protein [Chthoniobacteraceae bacterium]